MMPIHIMMRFIGVGIVVTLMVMSKADAVPVPSHTNVLYNDFNEVPDDILVDLMNRFGQTILRARSDLENSKRTVDFGLARGFSGTQEAKHRMGLAAANFPGGPGRRRRSETEA
ncbi:diuretic hormone class 2 isoform X2 [Eupeodes corollae]|uniref:diuretic hormone class 2 isoform X2 n=1 Tax=Eupeodes corollae TaxID=290404 RepID=UPI00249150D9|nr:diuretic hormone class 2 isoform X2 [Eupeodes corollae]